MSSQVAIIIPSILTDASQLSCLHQKTSIPSPPVLKTTSLSTCTISSFIINADNLLSTCCNTSDHTVIFPYTISASNDLVTTGGYTANGCDWAYCNVTGQTGIDAFEQCVSEAAPEVEDQCFYNGKARSGKARTSDARRRIGPPWKKTGKKTLSAGLLIALGIAGIFLG